MFNFSFYTVNTIKFNMNSNFSLFSSQLLNSLIVITKVIIQYSVKYSQNLDITNGKKEFRVKEFYTKT